jgi:HD-GYP domain-containing protein (c-di-GMP phosphodiesterase class II)
MKQHPLMSDSILSTVDLHPFVRQAARWSHEQIDGRGYPDGLAGDEIPLPARIVFVADAFDALTTDRPYRKARSAEAAIAEIRQNSGTQFCPDVVAALERAAAEGHADVFAGAEPGPYAWSLAQVSLSPSVRLKTSRAGVESGSGQK